MKSVMGLPKVFLVEDLACELGSIFQGMDCEIAAIPSVAEARHRLGTDNCAVLLMTLTSGLNLLLTEPMRAPVVLLSDSDLDESTAVKAYAAGASDIIQLPIHPEILRAKLKRFLDYRLAQRRVDNERQNFLNLYRQTPEMVCILRGPLHVFEMVNDAHIKVLGFDATGMAVREAQPESIEVHGILDAVYQTGKTAELREIPVTVGTSQRYFNLTYAARRDEHDQIDGIMILGTEITEQIRARSIQDASQARFRQLADSMPQIVYVSCPDGTVTFLNRRWYDFTGSPNHEGDNRISAIYIHPDDWLGAIEAWDRAQVTKQPYAAEIRIRSRTGDYRWFITRAEPNFENGVVIEWFGTSTDIHDQKSAAEELIRSRERYRMVFEGSPLPMLVLDRATDRILDANDVALQQYGYTRTEFMSMRALDLWLFEDNRDRARHRRKDGSVIHVESIAHDMTLDGRDVSLAAIVDVTGRVEAEHHLQAAKEEAERANRLKSAFLANMSHEIRTPLGAMIGFADLLRDTHIGSEEHANYIGVLTRNGEQLSIIINDILDLSKVEAGHLTLEYIDTNPRVLAHEVIELLIRKAQEKNLDLSFEAHASTPATLVTDPVRLRQVLLNLISNAIKFTQRGFVRLHSYGLQNEDGQTLLAFEVEDSGIGIPADQHGPIFEMFVQADGSVTRRFGGTGLGLALSRKLARALGGDVQVAASHPQEGSTFRFTAGHFPERLEQVPVLPPSQEKSLPGFQPGDRPLVGVKVLVVDDSPDNRRLVSQLLLRSGAEVETAEDGFEGYRRALTGDHHLVLMDVQMPLMDGYTTTQRLREHGYRKPIIALTAHAMTEVRKKCLNVGCNDHLPKPINPQDLIGVVARYALEL